MADKDIGENIIMLIEEYRPYCGVDVNQVLTDEVWKRGRLGVWEIWGRKMTRITE